MTLLKATMLPRIRLLCMQSLARQDMCRKIRKKVPLQEKQVQETNWRNPGPRSMEIQNPP